MRSVVILAVVLSAALLFLGSVTDAGLAMTLAGAVVWALYVAYLRESGARGLPLRLAKYALWGAVAWSAFQLVPLPAGVLRILSPHAAEIWSRADHLLGSAPRMHPISVDPPSTMFAAATAATTAIMYQASARYAAHRDARLRLIYAVICAVTVLNLVALAHRVGGVDKVYGAYTPRYPTSTGLLSPLLNPNHASAVACIAPPLIIGVALGRELPVRIVAAMLVILSSVVAVLSVSRMGMLVLGLELGVMGIYALSQRAKSTDARLVRLAFTGLAAAGILAAGFLLATEPVLAEARKTDVSKVRVPLQALSLARDYLVTGVGRGAFGSIFASYEGTLPPGVRYLYVEDWPVQLLCDMGIVAAGGYVGAIGAAVFLTRKRTLARPAYVGTLVALAGLAIHDLLDFSMEFAGAALPAAVLLAVVTSAGLRRPSTPSPRERLDLTAVVLVGALVGGALLAIGWHKRPDDEQRALQDRLKSGEAPASVANAAQQAIARHPADPFFYGLTGALRLYDPGAAAFLARSIELGPNRAPTHVALGKWLALSGRKAQAFSEFRAALRLEPHLASAVVTEMLRFSADLPELVAVVDGTATGDIVVGLLEQRKRFDDAAAVDDFLIETYPPAINARVRKIERARVAKNLDEARALAAQLRATAPESPQAWIASASLAETEDEAEAFLFDGIRRTGKDFAIVEALTKRRAIRLGLAAIPNDLAEYQAALERAGRPAYQFHVFKAEVELARHHPSAAIRYYLDAAAAAPESLTFIERAAVLAEQTGQTNMAQSLWTRLATMRPEDPKYREKVQHPLPPGSEPLMLPPPPIP